MNRHLILAAAAALILAPAAALAETPRSITVSLQGKDAATIKAEIRQAASDVCRPQIGYSPVEIWAWRDCAAHAAAAAEAKVAGALAAMQSAGPQVAMGADAAGKTQ